MKKIVFSISLLFAIVAGYSQGVEDVIVEKYYEASAADASLDPDGNLTAGAVTYRIYIDMADGYRLNSVYGTSDHTLFIETNGNFINNLDRGGAYGNDIGDSRLTDNTVALDSWVSLGAASAGNVAVLKSTGEDTDGSVLSFSNSGSDFTGLDSEDGFITGSPAGVAVIPAALETQIGDFFGDVNGLTGPRFEVTDGSWYAFGGVTGPNAENRVLVAQITTNGDLTFELNVQVQDASGAENWVARDAATGTQIPEFESDALSFTTINLEPSVTLTDNLASSYFEGSTIDLEATASDPDGSVAQVEFFLDGASVGVDSDGTDGYTASNVPVGAIGNHSVTAEVTDDQGAVVSSSNSLFYSVAQNEAPVVTISTDAIDIPDINADDDVLVTVNATDDEGDNIKEVDILVNGVVETTLTAGVEPFTGTFTYTFPDDGSYDFSAIAYDDGDRAGPESDVVTVSVSDLSVYYKLGTEDTVSVPCYAGNTFCVPLYAVQDFSEPVTGFDLEMEFDAAKVVPTGVVNINPDVHTGARTNADYAYRVEGNTLYLSVFMDGSGSDNYVWNTTGEILCVEFAKTSGFASDDEAEFSMGFLRESYELSNDDVLVSEINTFTYRTFVYNIFLAQLNFWADGSPIQGDSAAGYNSAKVYDGNYSYYAEPDENGQVEYDWVTGGTTAIRVEKDIDNDIYDGDTILSLFGGQDALLTQKVLVNDPSFTPNAYQMVAMDVNLDGKVTAGDVTQINQRAVQLRQEFANGGGVDWEFVALSDYMHQVRFQISTTWPEDDGTGRYSKENVPSPTNYGGLAGLEADDCPVPPTETFIMILLGDVDGSYKDLEHVAPGAGDQGSSQLKSLSAGSGVLFDLSNAIYEENFIDVPVRISSEEEVNAVDFAIMVNTDELEFMSVENLQKVEALSNSINANVWNTSYSLEAYNTDEPVFSVRFMKKGDEFSQEDFTYASAFINGKKVDVNFTKATDNALGIENNAFNVSVYPNPANNMFQVEVAEESSIQLIDMNGKVLRSIENVSDRTEVHTGELSSGIYMVRIASESNTIIKRIVISK